MSFSITCSTIANLCMSDLTDALNLQLGYAH